jgi:hypothetical protein
MDKPMLSFFKNAIGLPKCAANSAVLLDMACAPVQARALCRAINFWVKVTSLQESHILKICLHHQIEIMQD